ncbi:MAG: hypothetical protein F6K20_37545 [Moorea sp. SIO2C4]|nr:hypothetical protein [Moorena sp. SIO2C4]
MLTREQLMRYVPASKPVPRYTEQLLKKTGKHWNNAELSHKLEASATADR